VKILKKFLFEDSSVIEDPSLKTSNYINLGEKETLETYLVSLFKCD
jgi:hypothetical protein